jgi:glycosyltransferase involved in cell wall biosynthesis
VPVIIHTIHGFGFFDGQPPLKFHSYLNAERWVARHTDAFIAVSRANLVEARARGIVDSGHRLEVIRSGFDLSAFGHVSSEASETVRRELGIEDDDEIVLCVANLKSQKDPLTLVKAAATLLRRRPRLLVLYAGDGEMRDSVERVIANHNLGDRFRLLGWRTDIPELMSIADVVALSSRYEGLPKTSVQALAARKPFVGTRVDGTPEVIRNGQNGFLVEPNAPEALADALERALDERPVDPTDEERLRDWDQDEMVRAQERLYDSMTADKRAR